MAIAPARRYLCCVLAGALLSSPLLAAADEPAGTNVPDALTRRSGLRLAPMSRPAQTYALNCQGCHGEAGVSVAEVPTLAQRVGYFARIPEGRGYLVQVPNVALSSCSDGEIAEMMNWLLFRFSRAQLPLDFRPYTAEEVGRLRRERIDAGRLRQQLVARLLDTQQIPSLEALRVGAAAPEEDQKR